MTAPSRPPRVLAVAAVALLTACATARPGQTPTPSQPTAPVVAAPSVPAAGSLPGAARRVASAETSRIALAADLDALIDRPGHQHATWGVAVRSLRTGAALYARNAEALLVPASALKVATVAVAADAVGWDYTFTTAVEVTGPVTDGVLSGDIVLKGTGDPTTLGDGGADLPAAIAAALRQRGVTRIAGRVVADDNAVEEPRPGLAWSWDDLGTATGTLAGALNASENVARVIVTPGSSVGAATTVELPVDDTSMIVVNRSLTAAPGMPQTLWAERRPGEPGLTLAGAIAVDARPATLVVSVGNPTLWTARLVRARLIAAGVAVDGDAVDADDVPAVRTGEPLVTVPSAPLRDIARPMLRRSVNLYADAVLRLATGSGGSRDTAAGATAARDRLRAWGVAEGIRLVDGSGLSRFNLASADALAALLIRVWDGGASPLADALPVAGVDGTLAARFRGTPAAGNLRAKSGTMTHVRSLAGYVTAADGEPLAFAIIANNFEGPAAGVTATIDAMAVRLAAWRR